MGKFYEGAVARLVLYVRTLAWWHAVPVPKYDPNNPSTKHVTRLSRAEMRAMSGDEIDLPEIAEGFQFLVDLTFDIGPYGVGTYDAPLHWTDIAAWSQLFGVSLPPWQVRTVRRLATEYVAQAKRSADPDEPKPWQSQADKRRRPKIAGHVRNVLRGKT